MQVVENQPYLLILNPIISCHPQILSHCILVVIATMFAKEFTPEAHVALDKFLVALSLALAEKYR